MLLLNGHVIDLLKSDTRRKARFSLGLYNPRSLRDPASIYMVALYILKVA
jgi:hypothetical protein